MSFSTEIDPTRAQEAPSTDSQEEAAMTTNANIPDPIENEVQRMLVRNTVTGFEQGIAATIGLLTAGPVGALASWGTIRGVQGKWTPWFLLGIPAATVINLINFMVFLMVSSQLNYTPEFNPPEREEKQTSQVQPSPTYSAPTYQQEPQTYSQPATRTSVQRYPEPPVLSPVTTIAAANSGSAPKNNCWFGSTYSSKTGYLCSVSTRINSNGHTVYDLVQPNEDQTKRSVVLWDNGDVEFFLKGQRKIGTYTANSGIVSVTARDGQAFEFVVPQ